MLKKFFIISILIVLNLFVVNTVLAAKAGDPTKKEFPNPIKGVDSPQQLIGKVIQQVLGLVGGLALLIFVYGGLVWMTAAGAQEKVTKGRNILFWATVGIVVIFSSYAAVRFIMTSMGAI